MNLLDLPSPMLLPLPQCMCVSVCVCACLSIHLSLYLLNPLLQYFSSFVFTQTWKQVSPWTSPLAKVQSYLKAFLLFCKKPQQVLERWWPKHGFLPISNSKLPASPQPNGYWGLWARARCEDPDIVKKLSQGSVGPGFFHECWAKLGSTARKAQCKEARRLGK